MSKKRTKITIAVDTREQLPYAFEPYEDVEVRTMTLQHGDYSVYFPQLTRSVCIERKSLDDFANSCGNARKRFERELLAMRGYAYSVVVIEASYSDILNGYYRSNISPQSLGNTIAAWMKRGVYFLLADNRGFAEHFVYQFCQKVASDVLEYSRNACAIADAGGQSRRDLTQHNTINTNTLRHT